jgi:integrase
LHLATFNFLSFVARVLPKGPAMARLKLTDRKLKSLAPASNGKPFDLMDSEVSGLGVRVLRGPLKDGVPQGRLTFILTARYPGSKNPTRRAIGEYPTISLSEARDKARAWRALVKGGKDPAIEDAAQRRAEACRRENTFGAVAEDFIRLAAVGPDRTRPKQRKGLEVERDLRREFFPRWEARPITGISPHDVVAVLDEVVARGAPYQAHNLLGHVRRLFNWAIARGVYGLESSPCDRMKPQDVIGKKALRSRVLDDREVFALWRASGAMGYPFGSLFKLLIVTGQRKAEVGEARWREFHPDLVRLLRERGSKPINWAILPAEWKLWTIPPDRMKADAAHVVPLTEPALDVLATLPHSKRGDFIFSTTFGEKPVSGFSKAKARLDLRMLRTLKAMARQRADDWKGIMLRPFVLHDLRRTMRTGLSALPIPDLVRELVIAHTKPGLHRVYDQFVYIDEKRQALELWAARLRDIVSPAPANVVSLAARR